MCLNPQQERHERVAIAPTSLPANRSFAGAAAQQRAWQVRSERPLLDWELRMKLRPERSCRTQPRTDGSNPSLSSGESPNFQSLSGGRIGVRTSSRLRGACRGPRVDRGVPPDRDGGGDRPIDPFEEPRAGSGRRGDGAAAITSLPQSRELRGPKNFKSGPKSVIWVRNKPSAHCHSSASE
jgi:hypothetical protein